MTDNGRSTYSGESVDSNLQQAALALVEAGLPVFPLKPFTKLPLDGSRGFKDATTDPALIRRWWSNRPTMNIGVACGESLTVLDIDDFAGLRAFRKAVPHWREFVRSTTVVRTGRAGIGIHVWMQGADVGLSPSVLDVPKLSLRGRGGYVVAPPSVHPVTGNEYAFRGGALRALQPVPPVLIEAAHQVRNGHASPLADDVFVGTAPPLRDSERRYSRLHVDVLDRLIEMDKKPRRSGAGWLAFCPAHNDINNPSLTWVELADGTAWLTCRAGTGCEWQDIFKAMGMWDDTGPSSDHGHDRQRAGELRDWGDIYAESQPLDWDLLYDGIPDDLEWLYEPALLPGRTHLFFAAYEQGKSLILLYIAVELAKRGVEVVYFDFEMAPVDLMQRLEDFGVNRETIRDRLWYYSMPETAGLDTDAGAKWFRLHVERHPNARLVVIDTYRRAIDGNEDDSGVTSSFYRNAINHVKAKGIAVAILDHEGHEGSRPRGSSDKTQAVDHAWRVRKKMTSDNSWLFTLINNKHRITAFPEEVTFSAWQDSNELLRIKQETPEHDQAVINMIARLNSAGVPLDASFTQANEMLKTTGGKGGSKSIVLKALGLRRER